MLALCIAQAATPVIAQPGERGAPPGDEAARAQAKQRFEQAVADYDAERYEQALANFQEAHRLRPHPLVNVNIANCYDKLNKPLQAIFHFERFLESEAGTAAQRTEVGKALERLRKQVGQLMLRITPDGATVLIDQGEQRRAPILEPIRLEAGKHVLEVRLPGYRTLQRAVTVHGGTTFELSIALEPNDATPVLSVTPSQPEAAAPDPIEAPPPEPAPVQTDGPAEADDAGPSTGIWVAAAITGVLAVTGAITGVLALNADSEFEDKRAQLDAADDAASGPSDPLTPLARVALYNEARDAADRANALALTTDLLLFSAVIGGVVTVVLFATDDGGEEQAATARITPALSPHGGGVQLSAAF